MAKSSRPSSSNRKEIGVCGLVALDASISFLNNYEKEKNLQHTHEALVALPEFRTK